MQEVITQAENKMSVECVKKNLFACEEYVKSLTNSSLRGTQARPFVSLKVIIHF